MNKTADNLPFYHVRHATFTCTRAIGHLHCIASYRIVSFMQKSFWNKLTRPFFCLAPLANVTDAAFRRIIAQYGKPDIMWTEFVSADGLCSSGREVLLKDLMFTDAERPIVAQLFSSRPEKIAQAARLVRDLGFDGIDINMGCPDRSVEKQGAGAALMKDPSLAQQIIYAAKEGGGGLPVSVKTRVGYNKIEIDTWIPKLLETKLAALTVHARTRKEMSLVPARWEHMHEVIRLRDTLAPETLVIGNGDVKNLVDARTKAAKYGVDGVMLGRAIFGNPWLFSPPDAPVPVSERLRVMVEHTRLFEWLLGGVKSFAVMKKHYKAYASGFDGAKELRTFLMEAENAVEVERLVSDFFARG